MTSARADRHAAQSSLAALLFGLRSRPLVTTADWASLPSRHRADVVSLAAEHQVLPTLAARLLQRQAIPALPASAVTRIVDRGGAVDPVVVALSALNRSRSAMESMQTQLEVLSLECASAGIDVMPLKGGHQLQQRWWPAAGERSMSDLDLLVRDEHAGRVRDIALGLGYVELRPFESPAAPLARRFVPSGAARRIAKPLPAREGHHGRPLYLPGGAGFLEIHVEPMIRSLSSMLSADECWASSSAPVLADHLAVRQIVLHGVVVDCLVRRRRLPFRAAVDLVTRVEARHLAPVDFDVAFGPLYDRGFGAHVDAVVGFIRLHRQGDDIPAPRRPAAVRRWFREVDLMGAAIAKPVLDGAICGFDKHRLVARYGEVATEHPWRTRLQHLLATASQG